MQYLRATLTGLTGGLAVLVGQPVLAQGSVHDEDQQSRTTYPADFFTPLAPQTAYDMVLRTPGFVLVEGDTVRGFGGAAGNVLIDGERPTLKSTTLAASLRRIPAARVDRVEILRGGGLGSRAQGQSLVANLVLKEGEEGGSGNASLTLSRWRDGVIVPSGVFSQEIALGQWKASASLSVEQERQPLRGQYRITDPDGALIESWAEAFPGKSTDLTASTSLSGPFASGTLTVNGQWSRSRYDDLQQLVIHDGPVEGPALARRQLRSNERNDKLEFGFDWVRALAPDWEGKLLGLANSGRSRFSEDGTDEDGRVVSSLRTKPLEAIARITVARSGNHAFLPEIGAELAFNRLRSNLYYAFDSGSGLEPVDLPGADTLVRELRGEAFANLTIRLERNLRTEVGFAGEWSRLTVTGDTASRQSFVYWKPSAALIWDVAKKTQLRLSLRKTVDQLDFEDFAASVESADNRPISGNATLRPARILRAAAKIDHRWGNAGALSVELFDERRTGVLDYVSTISGGQAIGIAGNGRIRGVTMQSSLSLDQLLKGARLTLDATLRRTRLSALAGGNRPLGGIPKREFTASFRHDIETLQSSWGIDYTAASVDRIYFVDEVLSSRDLDVWTAYIETSAIPGFRTRIAVEGFTGDGVLRDRWMFDPTTNQGLGRQFRDRQKGSLLKVTVTKSW